MQIEKTFQIFFSHLQSGHEPRVLSSTTSQQLRKSSRLIGKRCGIYSTARSNSLLHPETSSTDAYTRAYTHSAIFRFLPSPFTAERISLILWRLSVKENHRNAFTPCRDTRSPLPRIQNALATTDELCFSLPSPLPSHSTSCISNKYNVSTILFEVKKIRLAFTFSAHLSH